MSILDYFDPLIFMISLCIGLAYTYYKTPTAQIIVKYPTPFNVNNVKYVDSTGTCYKYKIKESECPNDKSKIKQFVPQ